MSSLYTCGILGDKVIKYWIIAETLHHCWTKRVSNKVADHLHFQAHLDSELKQMKETCLSQLADDIVILLSATLRENYSEQ